MHIREVEGDAMGERGGGTGNTIESHKSQAEMTHKGVAQHD